MVRAIWLGGGSQGMFAAIRIAKLCPSCNRFMSLLNGRGIRLETLHIRKTRMGANNGNGGSSSNPGSGRLFYFCYDFLSISFFLSILVCHQDINPLYTSQFHRVIDTISIVSNDKDQCDQQFGNKKNSLTLPGFLRPNFKIFFLVTLNL